MTAVKLPFFLTKNTFNCLLPIKDNTCVGSLNPVTLFRRKERARIEDTLAQEPMDIFSPNVLIVFDPKIDFSVVGDSIFFFVS